jgi:(p)ppGpp synthase/HD superfamily hydrolase
MLCLTERYAQALEYAARAHGDQVRKGTDIPYISHPIAVSALVVEHGGTEDQAIAALLHDVLEDCGAAHAPVIAERFGQDVLRLVECLSDGLPDAGGVKPPWQERKEAYLSHLANADSDVILVSACDKLHNAIAIADDHSEIGDAVFGRFSLPKESTAWYYRELARVLADKLGTKHLLARRLEATLSRWA